MVNWRRACVPGGSFFFTVTMDGRAPVFRSMRARSLLGSMTRRCLMRMPFTLNAIVVLPDHLHAIWTLPRGDSNYAARWGWIKKEFTKEWLAGGGSERTVSQGRAAERRHGVWQPRYWEHVLEDEEDFERHFDYVHYNPVKHGHATGAGQWRESSFHRWVRRGVYAANWGRAEQPPPGIDDMPGDAGEFE